jgi:hypothetical protein
MFAGREALADIVIVSVVWFVVTKVAGITAA